MEAAAAQTEERERGAGFLFIYFAKKLIHYFITFFKSFISDLCLLTGQIRGLVRMLLIEAIARVIKNELNLLFRNKVRDATLPLEVTFLFLCGLNRHSHNRDIPFSLALRCPIGS